MRPLSITTCIHGTILGRTRTALYYYSALLGDDTGLAIMIDAADTYLWGSEGGKPGVSRRGGAFSILTKYLLYTSVV